VKSLYIVLASAIGLWFNSSIGFPFLYNSIVRLDFHECGIVCCL
jgi:hypothetical protein